MIKNENFSEISSESLKKLQMNSSQSLQLTNSTSDEPVDINIENSQSMDTCFMNLFKDAIVKQGSEANSIELGFNYDLTPCFKLDPNYVNSINKSSLKYYGYLKCSQTDLTPLVGKNIHELSENGTDFVCNKNNENEYFSTKLQTYLDLATTDDDYKFNFTFKYFNAKNDENSSPINIRVSAKLYQP